MRPLKASDIARALGVSPDWVQIRAARGDIPGAYKTGATRGHWRFEALPAAAWMADVKAGAAQVPQPKRKGRARADKADAGGAIADARAAARAALKEARNVVCRPTP